MKVLLNIKPCHLWAARDYAGRYHRYSASPVGGKFSGACYDGDHLCGVAVCGRPVAWYLDDGLTLKILYCCIEGTDDACPKLYGACCCIGFFTGYDRVIAYTPASKTEAPLQVARLTFDGIAGGRAWTGPRRRDYCVAPIEWKRRWMRGRIDMMP